MLFPVSGIEIHPLLPPVVSFVISFFTSMSGLSGAFLLLPFQMSVLGYTTPSVSATNQLFNIIAIPSGVFRYICEGRMVWPLTWAVIAGTLPGVLIGAVIRISYLPDTSDFKLFVGSVLLYVGFRLFKSIYSKKREQQPIGVITSQSFSLKKISYSYGGEQYTVPTFSIFVMTFIVGIIGGIYGIGGGAIIAPFFITFFGLPIYTVAGACLMGTFVTSIAGVGIYQLLAYIYPSQAIAPDYLLGILFGIGGFGGMYMGALCQKYVPATTLKLMLLTFILLISGKYILGYFL
ncbi:sulfite exporter TauE/SafE family protein [Halodesulfovibrio spirochaetisodalis]|uniref:Probable membrane transporter protein n=1 Tax=Halodesulfovibrio spirochaetisodalis TaxID=1560234 RepID=A0A1B7X8X8_9BACT|nr:sulfite exporter TauE/SafE family protein [Halodesulfovibrio spirochaetisodalis]OBQ45841.1 membrane protein [Halodesulfovibrio spirochaetisodalis]